MSRRDFVVTILFLVLIVTACGGDDGQEDQPAAAGEEPRVLQESELPPGEVTATVVPGATSTEMGAPTEMSPPAEATETAESEVAPPTETVVPTLTPTTAPTFTPTPAPVAYTSDGNPCIRPLDLQSVFSATGQAPLDVGSGDEDLFLAKLPRPYLAYAAFVPTGDSRLLVTQSQPFSDERGAIQITDIDTGQDIAQFRPDGRFFSPAMSREALLLAAINQEGQIWLWNLNEAAGDGGTLVTTLEGAGHLALSPDGQTIAVSTLSGDSVSRWGAARLIDVSTGRQLQLLEGEVIDGERGAGSFGREIANGHAKNIEWLGFTPNGEALLTLSNGDRTMRLWDIDSGEHLRCFELTDFVDVTSVSFNPNGREFATASGLDLLIWDTQTSQVDRQFGLPGVLGIVQGTVTYGADDVLVSTSTKEQAAYIWDSRSGQLLGLLRHPQFINGADISPDGAAIVTIVRDPFDASTAEAWVWNAEHAAVGLAATAQNLVSDGLARGQRGDIAGMVFALEEAQNLSPDDRVLLRAPIWQLACRYGGLEGQGAAVLDVCESAVQRTIDQGLGNFPLAKARDSRGIARALAGDFAGAIEDFQFYIDTLAFDQERVKLRQSWINSLQDGVNPIDQAALDALRDE